MPSQPLSPNKVDKEVLYQRFRSFFSSSFNPLFNIEKFSFFIGAVSRNIQLVTPTVTHGDEYCFSLLLMQAIIIMIGIALINAKVKSVIVFAVVQFSWGIERERETVKW